MSGDEDTASASLAAVHSPGAQHVDFVSASAIAEDELDKARTLNIVRARLERRRSLGGGAELEADMDSPMGSFETPAGAVQIPLYGTDAPAGVETAAAFMAAATAAGPMSNGPDYAVLAAAVPAAAADAAVPATSAVVAAAAASASPAGSSALPTAVATSAAVPSPAVATPPLSIRAVEGGDHARARYGDYAVPSCGHPHHKHDHDHDDSCTYTTPLPPVPSSAYHGVPGGRSTWVGVSPRPDTGVAGPPAGPAGPTPRPSLPGVTLTAGAGRVGSGRSSRLETHAYTPMPTGGAEATVSGAGGGGGRPPTAHAILVAQGSQAETPATGSVMGVPVGGARLGGAGFAAGGAGSGTGGGPLIGVLRGAVRAVEQRISQQKTEEEVAAAAARVNAPAKRMVPAAAATVLGVAEVDVTDEAAFQRVVISGPAVITGEQREASRLLQRALALREKHCYVKNQYYWGACQPEDFPFSPRSRAPPVYPGTARRSSSHASSHHHHHHHAHAGGGVGVAPAASAPSGGLRAPPSVASSGGIAHAASTSTIASTGSSIGGSGGGVPVLVDVSASGSASGSPLMSAQAAGGGQTQRARLTPGGSIHPLMTGMGSALRTEALAAATGGGGGGPASASASSTPTHTGASGGPALHASSSVGVFSIGDGATGSDAAAPAGSASASASPARPLAAAAAGAVPAATSPASGAVMPPPSTTPGLVTPTLTGVSVAASTTVDTAIEAFKKGLLHGSSLVSLETGKDYGNLFYRRRLEPPYRAFSLPLQPSQAGIAFGWEGGVVQVRHATASASPADLTAGAAAAAAGGAATTASSSAAGTGMSGSLFPVPTFAEYRNDYSELIRIMHTPFVKSYAFRRLQLLEARFQLHRQLNAEKETAESKAVPHRDFYNVRKVDTHVHHSACMNQKHLLNFIKAKLKHEPDEVVIRRDGKDLTLREVFESLSLTAYDLSVDTLDMHADWTTFHRFDRFNLKYNPVGQSRLREIFLKTDNFIKGRYLAEITHEVFADLEAAKYSLAEYRLSVYGKSKDEWGKLAAWVVDNGLASSQVRWMIQIPRLYETYRETGSIKNFGELLENIFMPLFEVSRDPSVDPKLHQFLGTIVGFDSVDDESKQEVLRDGDVFPLPAEWTVRDQPPYFYWNYFIAANTAVLNKYRESRGMTQFSFRPHAGEAGDVDHLAATFLTAESINHGINLRKNPTIQYLYYLAQIGLAVSPLSNNKLFVEYNKNPFNEFFAKGLNVSLSTDDPLILSYTREALIEEYCVATQVWKFSAVDMCEIARNSVLQSGFEFPYKAHFVGPHYMERGPAGNDINSTNVPYIRLQYRLETLNGELALLAEASAHELTVPRPLPLPAYTAPAAAVATGASSVASSGAPSSTSTTASTSSFASGPLPPAAGAPGSAGTSSASGSAVVSTTTTAGVSGVSSASSAPGSFSIGPAAAPGAAPSA